VGIDVPTSPRRNPCAARSGGSERGAAAASMRERAARSIHHGAQHGSEAGGGAHACGVMILDANDGSHVSTKFEADPPAAACAASFRSRALLPAALLRSCCSASRMATLRRPQSRWITRKTQKTAVDSEFAEKRANAHLPGAVWGPLSTYSAGGQETRGAAQKRPLGASDTQASKVQASLTTTHHAQHTTALVSDSSGAGSTRECADWHRSQTAPSRQPIVNR
jgi:hypothetical protein